MNKPANDPRYSALQQQYPVRVAPLDYQRNDRNKAGIGIGKQFVAGVLFPYAYGFLPGFVASLSPDGVEAIVWLGVIVFVVLVVIIRVRTRWKGFVPGVLCGVFVVPILAVAICTAIVGPPRFHG